MKDRQRPMADYKDRKRSPEAKAETLRRKSKRAQKHTRNLDISRGRIVRDV